MKLYSFLAAIVMMTGSASGQGVIVCQDGLSDTDVRGRLTVSEEMLVNKMVPVVKLGTYTGYVFPETKLQIDGRSVNPTELKKISGRQVTAKIRMLIPNGQCGGRKGSPGTFTTLDVWSNPTTSTKK